MLKMKPEGQVNGVLTLEIMASSGLVLAQVLSCGRNVAGKQAAEQATMWRMLQASHLTLKTSSVATDTISNANHLPISQVPLWCCTGRCTHCFVAAEPQTPLHTRQQPPTLTALLFPARGLVTYMSLGEHTKGC